MITNITLLPFTHMSQCSVFDNLEPKGPLVTASQQSSGEQPEAAPHPLCINTSLLARLHQCLPTCQCLSIHAILVSLAFCPKCHHHPPHGLTVNHFLQGGSTSSMEVPLPNGSLLPGWEHMRPAVSHSCCHASATMMDCKLHLGTISPSSCTLLIVQQRE